MTDDPRQQDRRFVDMPPPTGVERRAGERRRGRPPNPDTRKLRLRVSCNDQELLKLQLLARYNRDLKIATMLRDIILDDVNEFLAHCPRHELVVLLREMGQTEIAIEAMLKTL